MFLNDDGATRLEYFLDIFGVGGDGEMLEAVVVPVPSGDVGARAVFVILLYDLGEPVFDVHSRTLVLVVRTELK